MNALKWSGWLFAIVFAFLFFRESCAGPANLIIGPVRQDIIKDKLPEYAVTNPRALLAIANDYLTEPGWLASSNGRVYAGLVDRVWSAPYTLPKLGRHEVTLWAGQGIGASYQYNIFSSWSAGAMLIYAGNHVSALAGVGYHW